MIRKRSLVVFMIVSLMVGLFRVSINYPTKAAEDDVVTSVDEAYEYRELSDGTISLVKCSGGLEKLENGGNQLTVPDEVDGKMVSGIESDAFNGYVDSSVSTVILPRNLKTLDITVLRDLYFLTSITIDASNENFCTEDGILFNKDKSTLLRVPPAFETEDSSNDYVIADTVTAIGDDAFFNCYSVYNITISKNVKTIGNCAFFRYLASNYTFTFTVDADNEYFVLDEQGNLYSKDKTVLYRYVYPEDEAAMYNLPTFEVPDTVKTIASAAFQGSTGSGWIDGLVSVTIPDSVTEIGERAFEGCSYLGDSMTAPLADASTEVVIPDSVVKIGKRAFFGCSMESVVLPKNLMEIAPECFAECNYLTKVTIPDEVTVIGKKAFVNCAALSEVTFGKNVSKISEYAFHNCSSLTKMTVPNYVTDIFEYAFGFIVTSDGVVPIDGFILNCEEGSTAAAYAKTYGLSYTTGGEKPTPTPTVTPTVVPTATPTVTPTVTPTATPTEKPTIAPTVKPTVAPAAPTVTPTQKPAVTKPAAVSKLTLKNKKGKKMVVSWKQVKDASGYQIQYSTSKKLKAAKKVTVKKASTTKVTVKKLKKKKKYYVRIRSYKVDGTKKLYSSWSKVKKLKITK